MEPEKLTVGARTKLEKLLTEIQKSLNAKKSPHIRAVSRSSVELGQVDVLGGGSIEPPEMPGFDYNQPALLKLHHDVLKSADPFLHCIIVHAERADIKSKWQLRCKLVSHAEHGEITTARKRIDTEIEELLRPLAKGKKTESVAFGLNRPGQPPRLVRFDSSGVEKLKPTAALLKALEQTKKLYTGKELNLIIASWDLGKEGLEFEEYFE